jgi:hypothetical protein
VAAPATAVDRKDTSISRTIGSLLVPVSDQAAAKAVYTALHGAPHTDRSYHVEYNVDRFEVGLNPAGGTAGPVAFADAKDLRAARATLLRRDPARGHPR